MTNDWPSDAVVVRLDAIDDVEMEEIVIEAWRIVVPKRVAQAHLDEQEVKDVKAERGG